MRNELFNQCVTTGVNGGRYCSAIPAKTTKEKHLGLKCLLIEHNTIRELILKKKVELDTNQTSRTVINGWEIQTQITNSKIDKEMEKDYRLEKYSGTYLPITMGRLYLYSDLKK